MANQTDVFVVDSNNAIQVQWVQGAGTWRGPIAISSNGSAPAGAHLAVSQQFGVANQTDVFVVNGNDALQVRWVQGSGKWNGPLAISPPGVAPAGAQVTASPQFGVANQTDVFVVANDGTTRVSWVQAGGTWQGPLGITPTNFAAPGVGLAASNQFGISNQTDVFVVAENGTTDVSWVEGAGAWKGPLQI